MGFGGWFLFPFSAVVADKIGCGGFGLLAWVWWLWVWVCRCGCEGYGWLLWLRKCEWVLGFGWLS